MKQKLFTILLSISMVFGLFPMTAFADEIGPEYGSSDPTGKHGLFGYAMSLDPSISPTYFPGTADWTLDTQGEIGGQDLEFYAEAQTGWWKYYIYNRFFSKGDSIIINPISPVATEPNVDFLFWYQKDVTNSDKASGINNEQSFYKPGENIFYDGGEGKSGVIPSSFPVYSVDAIWSIWNSKNKTQIYDGLSHLPNMSYTYSYDSTKGINFNSDLNQLEELTTLEIIFNNQNIYIPTDEDQTWSSEISEEIILNKGSQTNVGTYQYNYKVDYRRKIDSQIIGTTDDTAQLVIQPRPITITGTEVRDYNGDNITINFNENQFASWTETTVNAGVANGQNILFNIPVSGLNPGTYSVDVTNKNVKIVDKNGIDVTSNYIIDGEVTLIIKDSIIDNPETDQPQEENKDVASTTVNYLPQTGDSTFIIFIIESIIFCILIMGILAFVRRTD